MVDGGERDADEGRDHTERRVVANGAKFILVRHVSSVCESTIDLLLAPGSLRTNGRIASKPAKNGASLPTRSRASRPSNKSRGVGPTGCKKRIASWSSRRRPRSTNRPRTRRWRRGQPKNCGGEGPSGTILAVLPTRGRIRAFGRRLACLETAFGFVRPAAREFAIGRMRPASHESIVGIEAK